MKSESEADGQREDSAVVARVCWSYFKEGQTQEAVAQRLGPTRKCVNRILNDARASGFVQITINDPISACAEPEAGLQSAFGLRRAIVVPTPPADAAISRSGLPDINSDRGHHDQDRAGGSTAELRGRAGFRQTDAEASRNRQPSPLSSLQRETRRRWQTRLSTSS
ncbi:hypothetical protein [Reyranella soli]|jgi:hypothetical protein|uniref:Sugar-binding domain-containing protein n=1 Tax=Reyranella soli TaxID=1230389 RepID=A0A512N7D4_9HYPH|nr:hypothetical protein [Reyranella soli]GEP54894.1 hypothetical protein RSO01_20600 [Reyranella soli]